MGGHGLEAIAAGIYGLFAPDLGEDLSLRIAGRVGVENQRPLDRRDAARIVYEQTVVTLEGMISAGFGDLEVGARIQSEGNMTLVQLLASVKDGSSGVRLETTFNDDGSISPRLIIGTTLDGSDYNPFGDDEMFGPHMPPNALEIFVEPNGQDGEIRVGGQVRLEF